MRCPARARERSRVPTLRSTPATSLTVRRVAVRLGYLLGYVSEARLRSKGVDMPQGAWNEKRERQYDHIKEGLRGRGEDEDTAEEIAARTVNKERARAGEAKEVSRTSTEDISSGRRGGLRSHRGPGGRTRDQLYTEAREKGIEGRSKMKKAELERAVGR
jgi:hypothetical protein